MQGLDALCSNTYLTAISDLIQGIDAGTKSESVGSSTGKIPIMPIHRLNEPPVNGAVRCSSTSRGLDGKIDHFTT